MYVCVWRERERERERGREGGREREREREREGEREGGRERELSLSHAYTYLQADAEIDTQDSNGFTALLYAVRQGHQTVVQLLLETGADLTLT